MSATRYDAISVRTYEKDGEEKSAFTNIGVAFQMKERDGFSIRLHAMPAPVDGEYSILLMPPKPREDQQQRQPDRSGGDSAGRSGGREQKRSSYDDNSGGQSGNFSRDMDDDIPF
jgi:hypothetical protein